MRIQVDYLRLEGRWSPPVLHRPRPCEDSPNGEEVIFWKAGPARAPLGQVSGRLKPAEILGGGRHPLLA